MAKSMEDVYEMLRRMNIPIATLDAKWLQLFRENEKTPKIKKLEKDLSDTMKRQGKVNTDLKDLRVLKERLMQGVLNTADDRTISESKRQKKQNASQKLIRETKQKIEELEEEQLQIPQRIRDANTALIIESVRECYERINKNREDIRVLDEWIEETRAKLKEKVIVKQDKEIQNQNIYTYLHDMLGVDIMEVFDEEDS